LQDKKQKINLYNNNNLNPILNIIPPNIKKKPPTHSEPQFPNKLDTSSTKSTDKENPNTGQVSKDNQSNLSAAKENQGPLTKEKADPISTPSYADIARSTTPTNTPSNSTVSD
jgi:hypothetical protein